MADALLIYSERLKIFTKYVAESIAFYKIPSSNFKIESTNSPGEAAINFVQSNEEQILFRLGDYPVVDTLNLRRQAWHEVTHWKLALEGYPVVSHVKPVAPLNWIQEDKEWIGRSILPNSQLSASDRFWIFHLIQQLIADVVVSRTIKNTPVFLDTLKGISNQNVTMRLKHHSIGELCYSALLIIMESEYSKLAMSEHGEVYNAAINLDKVQKKILRKIYEKAINLENMTVLFSELCSKIVFTRDRDKLLNWVIATAELIPKKYQRPFTYENAIKLRRIASSNNY